MQLCWTNSESRPAMAQIDLMLGDLLQVYKNTTVTKFELNISMSDFDKRWESFKPNSIVKTDNHITDSTELDLDDSQIVTTKSLSPSLNNLHGSLDNLLADSSDLQMESWLENVATKTGDMSYVKGLSDAIKDLDNVIDLENNICSDSGSKVNTKIEFKLGPLSDKNQIFESPSQSESLNDSLIFVQRPSSGSETEEENWKKKIERGAYSEKVRQKSRSVADLMILTHIDQSESESETPLPSLDYRTNYKNVRYAPKQNLETCSLMFGSEGNLLNVQETFQEELKKLQEERRDSLLFVPENSSQNKNSEKFSDSAGDDNVSRSVSSGYLENSPSKRILQELNDTSEIKPANQVFNVFNVTIDKYSPVRLNPSKLDEFINFKENEFVEENESFEVPKLSDIIRSNTELVNYLNNSDLFEKVNSSDNLETLYDSGVEGDKVESTESLRNIDENDKISSNVTVRYTSNAQDIQNTIAKIYQVPKLVDLIQDNDELMDYIIARYETESVGKMTDSLDSLETPANELVEIKQVDCIKATKEFLNEEIKCHSDIEKLKVAFDLSEHQDEAMPNSLTHSGIFSSTPFCNKKSLQELTSQHGAFSSLNLFEDSGKKNPDDESNLYSLETWDNFLGKALDSQNESQENEFFDSFSSEPQSLLFTANEINEESIDSEPDRTYTVDKDKTFTKEQNVVDINDINVEMETNDKVEGNFFLRYN